MTSAALPGHVVVVASRSCMDSLAGVPLSVPLSLSLSDFDPLDRPVVISPVTTLADQLAASGADSITTVRHVEVFSGLLGVEGGT